MPIETRPYNVGSDLRPAMAPRGEPNAAPGAPATPWSREQLTRIGATSAQPTSVTPRIANPETSPSLVPLKENL